MSAEAGDDLLTVAEAAKALHPGGAVKPATIRAAINKGVLPARRFGRTLLVLRTDLERYKMTGDKCQEPTRDRGSSSTVPTANTGLPPKPDSSSTSTSSVGMNVGRNVSAQQALQILSKPSRSSRTSSASDPVPTNQDHKATVLPLRAT
ncbi:helix-turn-helix domain-containing protein [Azospirillum formosense]|uniref:Helix-turn-helix domain-containing protein n=1 Tax=Azospirillum formosense TaxID=861533 RepID=A0ABX2KYC9_9PROT|nr:helix-turn-helix domain-containing protein [Azospirillum formosense]NUB19220.1 helix-turn-helix domain-containing protein [Azospirillum formosense]